MPKSTFTPAYGELIALLVRTRLAAGVTQEELARRLGKPQPIISNIERGVRRLDVIELIAIAHALGVDPAALFSDLLEKLPKQLRI